MTPIFFRLDGEGFALVHRAFADGLSHEFTRLSGLETRWLLRSWREHGQIDGMARVLETLSSADRVREETRVSATERSTVVSDDRGEYLLYRYDARRPSFDLDFSDHAVDLSDFASEAPVETIEHFVEVLVVDERDQPLPGISCVVELSNGQLRSGRTDDFGLLRIDGIVPAGPCSIRFPTLTAGAIEPA